MTNAFLKKLVIIPSDPIRSYDIVGIDWLERYFNPQGFFNEVNILDVFETENRTYQNLTVIGMKGKNFSTTLQALKPNVIRSYGGFFPADLACNNRIQNVPIVISLHDSRPELIHKTVKFADLVICMSRIVAQNATAKGVDPWRIRILPNRVDTKIFYPVTNQSLIESVAKKFPEGKHILHVGRKDKQKNLDTLIKALKYLPDDYYCIFIGRGDISSFVDLAKNIGVSDRCFWIETIKNSDLPLWYSWCDCMCTPSRFEGFGIVFIEAAACGSAIITSDIAPMNEYLSCGENALLIKNFENPSDLAKGILKVCEDRGFHEIISQGAIEMAKMFDREIIDSKEVKIYEEVMSLPIREYSYIEKIELFFLNIYYTLLQVIKNINFV